MYDVKQYMDKNYTIYELSDSTTSSWVKVAPERGGIIIGFGVNGEELLFLNKETFFDSAANVRGGIPILFPISGQLTNGEYEWNGQIYHMNNHGLARNYPWTVIKTSTVDSASITLSLTSSPETKKSYPFEFEVIFTYVLKENKLSIHQEYINKSADEMPFYAGFHPYFKTTHKNLVYETDAKTYLDYNDFETKQVSDGLNLTGKKESFALLDAVKKEIAFELPDRQKKLLITYGEEFKPVYLWTEEGQDFVCVEPWMANTNELNRKEELVILKPGEHLKTFMTFSAK